MDGVLAAGEGEVGADAVGDEALVEDAVADVEAEVAAAVGGVQPDAPVVGLAGLGDELAVGADDAAGVGGEEVGDDVSFLEDGEKLADDLGVVAVARCRRCGP